MGDYDYFKNLIGNDPNLYSTGTGVDPSFWKRHVHHTVTPGPVPTATEPPVERATPKVLKYKDVTITLLFDDEVMAFFEDPLNITREELQLLEITYPAHLKKFKAAWMDKYTKLQALKAFESL